MTMQAGGVRTSVNFRIKLIKRKQRKIDFLDSSDDYLLLNEFLG